LLTQARRHLCQTKTFSQQLAPGKVGGYIPVAKLEPGFSTQALQRLEALPGFTGQAPTLLLVVKACQGIHHGVQVWRYMKTQVLKIIRRIGNYCQLPRIENPRQAQRELGPSNPAGDSQNFLSAALVEWTQTHSASETCPVPGRAAGVVNPGSIHAIAGPAPTPLAGPRPLAPLA